MFFFPLESFCAKYFVTVSFSLRLYFKGNKPGGYHHILFEEPLNSTSWLYLWLALSSYKTFTDVMKNSTTNIFSNYIWRAPFRSDQVIYWGVSACCGICAQWVWHIMTEPWHPIPWSSRSLSSSSPSRPERYWIWNGHLSKKREWSGWLLTTWALGIRSLLLPIFHIVHFTLCVSTL